MDAQARIEELERELGALRVEQATGYRASRAPWEDPAVARLLGDRKLLASLPDVITILDAEYRFLYVSRVVPGRRIEDFIGRRLLDYLEPDARDYQLRHLNRAWNTGEVQRFESRSVGGYVWETRLVPILEDGKTAYLLTTSVDMTEHRRLEDQLRQSQKMDAIGQLTSGIAHNFNNVLAIIVPSVELARRDASPPVAARLDDIAHAAERGAEMVRQLLLFTRRDMTSRKSPLDLAESAGRTADICRTTFNPGITVSLAAESGLPHALANAGQIEQVLLNVCLNARDALEEACTPNPQIMLRVDHPSANVVRLRVSDNGPGMDEATRARIFEPFFTTKAVQRGTGLGLASAYAIVTDHGGTLVCESRLGAGATFSIELPSTHEVPAAAAVPTSLVRRGSELLLLVDDEPVVRRVTRELLEVGGYRVLEASDGSSAIACFEQESPRIGAVILDRAMPGLSGDVVLGRLHAIDPRVPVIMLSGHGDGIARCEKAAASLAKPTSAETLLGTLRDVLDRSP